MAMSEHDQQKVKAFADALREALALAAPGSVLSVRKMFGGAGYYADGRIFAAWTGGATPSLKLAEAERNALLQQGGTPDTIFREYVMLPAAMVNEPPLMADWVRASLSYVAETARKPKRR